MGRTAIWLVATLAALALAAPAEATQRGGKVTYLASGDIDFLDPAQTYYSFAYMVQLAVNRPLYGFRPGGEAPVPDLAAAPPQISDDQRSVTVRIRPGVNYAPPVDRAVVADDVRYAIERAFRRSVAGPYATTYFSDLVGAPRRYQDRSPSIEGIETPDRHTLVFRLRRPVAARFAASLVMPITVPVPRDFAQRFDRGARSSYGDHVAFSGPYRVDRYRPGRELRLARNPNWDPASDYRPAYLDRIRIAVSVRDIERAARRTRGGRRLLCCDGESPRVRPTASVSSSGTRWIALNTQVRPLNRLAVRRAIIASLDRRRLAGGSTGRLATHFLPPSIGGHGAVGAPPAFLKRPGGDLRLARRYLRRAGVRPGRTRRLLIVGSGAGTSRRNAIAVDRAIRRLGFRTRLKLVSRAVMFVRFCNRPAARVAICPSVGWDADFDDPEAMLRPVFDGDEIRSRGNVNWSQLSVPRIDRAMDAASVLPAGAERNAAWAAIDRRIVGQAAGAPVLWDRAVQYASSDVDGRMSPYSTTWDLSFTGLESTR